MKVGVLAIQGDFGRHIQVLEKLNVTPVQVKTERELSIVDGLIIPGGESTTIVKLLKTARLFEIIKQFAEVKPVFGTCAGSIILAAELAVPDLDTLGVLNIKIHRNAYGTQLDSFYNNVTFNGNEIEAVFIRAPRIIAIGENVSTLISLGTDPILVRQKNILACTFHPELTDDLSIHQYFLDMF